MEASGTSGMKAAANGVPNCSILDGWWVEGYSPDVGWAIGRGESYTDSGYQDHVESMALYDLLEKQIIPQFYHRGVDNIPREWIARMKNCMRKLAPQFSTNRMVRDYTEQFYVPALVRGVALAADNLGRATNLAHVKDRLRQKWGGIKIVGVHTTGNGHYKVGEAVEVAVQLYYGSTSAAGEIEQPQALLMEHTKQLAPTRHVFTGHLECKTSGRQGFAIRVLPGVSDLASPFEPGLIVWN
jgi:starch phosphorylase